MYWACFDDTTGARAVIFSATDPADTNERWTETWPYDTADEANESISRD